MSIKLILYILICGLFVKKEVVVHCLGLLMVMCASEANLVKVVGLRKSWPSILKNPQVDRYIVLTYRGVTM